MNGSRYNRKLFLTLLAVKATNYFNNLPKPDRVVSLVPDDSVIPHECSRQVELLSRVYNHVTGKKKTVKGFNIDKQSSGYKTDRMLSSTNRRRRSK